jgi:hypothetical protein
MTGKLGRLRIPINERPYRVVLRTPADGKRIFGFSQNPKKLAWSVAKNAAVIARKSVLKPNARSISMRIKKKQAS